jgi:RimJ/RimL family protein N-acetyltransferase
METKDTLPPVIWRKGKLTLLRPLEEADAPKLYRWINDPATNRFLASMSPKGIGFETEWIKSKQAPSDTDVTVGICTLNGELIGTMGLHRIDLMHGTAVTGALIGEETYRGKGYGTDAKMLLLDYAFNCLGLHKVQSKVIAFNERSAAYSKKCGYVEEGRLKEQWFRFGQRHDEILLAVFRETWLPLWEAYWGG